jgi:putative endonuclease
MAEHNELGKQGEELAVDWLLKQNFVVLRRNFRYGRYEVDIIAGRHGILHFIEVKCRHSTKYGHPEEGVSKKKLEHLLQGSQGWLVRWPGHRRVQYDVLAITLRGSGPIEYKLFEDVYL